jgi:hypothetical protein
MDSDPKVMSHSLQLLAKAGSTLAANSRGIKRFLTPSLAAC